MKLQKATRYGLYAVLELASDPQRQLSTAEIAEKYGISGHHLAKVMHRLVRSGLARSVRGAGGGYTFAGKASRLTLLDIVELFEEPGADPEDADETADGTEIGRALRGVQDEIDDMTTATLRSITVKTLLTHAQQRPETREAAEAPRRRSGT